MNGGYLMIFKNDSDIYVKAQKALTLGKPILFYENATTCYYIDTISGGEITTEIVDDEEVTSYGDIILTKGGKTITITSANAVSESGNIQNHLYANNIYIKGDNEDTNTYYAYITIYADKILTDDDIKNYIKQFNGSNNHLLATGYCDSYSIIGLHYYNDKYWYNDSNDSSMQILSIDKIVNKAIQLF